LTGDRIAWIQTGDGAVEEGVFYESLVFSIARSLPVVFILEDNNWSLGTSRDERRHNIDYTKLCKSIGIRYFYISSTYPVVIQAFFFALPRSLTLLFSSPSLIHIDHLTLGSSSTSPGRPYISYH